MSSACSDLCCVLIEETLGALVAKVVRVLFSCPLPLPLIVLKAGVTFAKARQSLSLLLQRGMVDCSINGGKCFYAVNPEMLLTPVQYPVCIVDTKSSLGDLAESIVEELVAEGDVQPQKCVDNVHSKLGTDKSELCNAFQQLVSKRIIVRCDDVTEVDAAGMPKFTPHKTPFLPPTFKTDQDETSRKRKLDVENGTEDGLWRINWDRLRQRRRDQLMVHTVRNMHPGITADIVQAALAVNETKQSQICAQSAMLSAHDIVRMYSDTNSVVSDARQIQLQLNLLNAFVRRTGDSGGGMYSIDFGALCHSLCCCTIESIIREKFGSRSVRIFKVLLDQSFLEQNEIEQMTMLASKDGKELVYELLAHHYISVKEVCKTNDYAPAKSFYLFFVELKSVASMQRDITYKTLKNITLRRRSELEKHRGLLERQEKVETIVSNIQADESVDEETKASQVAEVEQAFLTEAERQLLETHEKHILRLHHAHAIAESTLFILDTFIHMQ